MYEILNKLKWTGKLHEAEIVIVHRGAPGDRKILKGSSIIQIKRSYFVYRNSKEVFIPMHRVCEIRVGKKIWKGRKV